MNDDRHNRVFIEKQEAKTIINNFPHSKKPIYGEVQTIMELIKFLSDDKNYKEIEKNYEVDPEKKFKNKLKEYSKSFTEEYWRLFTTYGQIFTEAKNTMDNIKAEKIKNFLITISNSFLDKKPDNPKEAFSDLCDYFEEKMKIEDSGNIDHGAIRFYLLSELIDCNVFSEEVK